MVSELQMFFVPIVRSMSRTSQIGRVIGVGPLWISSHEKTNENSNETVATKDCMEQTLRRVNRRIRIGVDAVMSGEVKRSNAKWVSDGSGTIEEVCIERVEILRRNEGAASMMDEGDYDEMTTVVFLHGFGDSARQWEAFAKTITKGLGVKVVLPEAPKRFFAHDSEDVVEKKGEELFSGRAWFAPRLLPSRSDYESMLADFIDDDDASEETSNEEMKKFSCSGIRESFESLKRLIERQKGDVVISGFSQGAAMAMSLMCSGDQKPKNLIGCVSFRGYLPRRPDASSANLPTSTTTPEKSKNGKVLMLAGEEDPLVPVRWTKEANTKGTALGLEIKTFFSEGHGHDVTGDDVLRARGWLRDVIR